MEEYTQITLEQWVQWKEDIRRKLQETAGNFVYIGYRLKQIRDSGMFDGCEDIFEFARKEYGLTESTVSRFISINEEYSEGGNSLELRAEFRGLNYSILSEMLTLPEQDRQLITEKTTVKDIRELKRFNKQVPDAAAGVEETQYTPLQKCVIEFFRDKQKRLDGVMDATARGDAKEMAEIMNPGGNVAYKKGIIFLFLYDYERGVKYKSMTEPAPVTMTWEECMEMVADIYWPYYGVDGTYKNFYAKEEKSTSVATSQESGEKVGEAEEGTAVATSKESGENSEESVDEEKVGTRAEEGESEEEEEGSTTAAGVPEEIGPERSPRGKSRGDGISRKEPKAKKAIEHTVPPADAEYTILVGKIMLQDIRSGQRFLIIKKANPYREGNTLHLREYKDGEPTGRGMDICVTHSVDDHGGITPGYCVLQFDVLPPAEEQMPGQMSLGDVKDEQENTDEVGKKTGIYGESQESDT